MCLLFYCCYLLLASAVSAVSGVTPVTYPAVISQRCQSNPLHDKLLMEALYVYVPCVVITTPWHGGCQDTVFSTFSLSNENTSLAHLVHIITSIILSPAGDYGCLS